MELHMGVLLEKIVFYLLCGIGDAPMTHSWQIQEIFPTGTRENTFFPQ
jgi:hypothetical protein